jgi:hypothetical protein
MRKLVLFIALATPALYSQEETPDHRLRTSTDVLHEIMSAPDKGIPNDLLSKAQCVVIVPELKKAAFIVGGIMAVDSRSAAITIPGELPRQSGSAAEASARRLAASQRTS